VFSLEQFRLRAQAEQLENAGRLSDAARVRIALIEAETRAVADRFAQRELELRALAPETEAERLEQADELAQLAHEREVSRLETEAELRRTVDAEKQRLADLDAERLTQQREQLNQWIGSVQQVQSSVTGFAQQMISRRNQAADAEHSAQIKRMQDAGKARDASFEAQLKAAQGHVEARKTARQE
jgi:hypothetical protein